jgi:protein involved in polysaccharide export with SLBB domain
MGLSFPLFLTRVATIFVAGMLLFAVFTQARAQDDNYGLKRFSGDYYDTVPTPARTAPPVAPSNMLAPSFSPAPPVNAYTPAPYAMAPATPVSNAPYGYKQMPPALPVYPTPRVAAQTAPYAYAQHASDFDYVLGQGDRLRLIVFGESDLSGEFTIDGAGFVRLPLVGEVRAAGYTAPQLEGAVAAALNQGYLKSPRVAVEVASYRPFYIIGAVNRPGQYPYVDHMNALNAVALAGGFQTTAVESVVFIRREGSNQEVEMPVDRTTDIRPGDVVKVHTTIFSDAVSLLSPFSGVAASAATAAVIN